MNFNNAMTLALQSVKGYGNAITALKVHAVRMDRKDFRQLAVPVVAAFYKVKAVESQKGGLSLEKDTAAYKALSRIISAAYGGNTAPRVVTKVRLTAAQTTLVKTLASFDRSEVLEIFNRVRAIQKPNA